MVGFQGYPGVDVVADYIRRAAIARGIDPNVALKVARAEGLARNTWQSNLTRGGHREPSYGPFQLLKGGPGTGYRTGMGNDFQAATGLDPADPANWQQSVDFALNQAARGGWSPWYGARAVGVTGMEGVGGAKAVGVSPQTRPATPADVGGMPGQTMPVDTPAGTAPGASVPQPPASSVPPWTPLEAKNEWWKNFKMPDLNFTPQGPPPQFSSVIPAEAPPMSLGGPLGSLSTEPPQAPGALQALAQAQEGPGPGQYYEPDPLTGKLKAGTRLRRRIL